MRTISVKYYYYYYYYYNYYYYYYLLNGNIPYQERIKFFLVFKEQAAANMTPDFLN